MNPRLGDIRRYLENNRERHVARLQRFLRQPSVSVNGEGETCAWLFADLLRDVGFTEADVVRTSGLPGVWGAYEAGAPVTLAFYGMLDVRGADPVGWRVPPFSAEIVEMPPFRSVLVGRGARAVKGPLCVWLNAVEACRAVLGRPPVNLYLLAESDEILGSPHYRDMMDRYRDRLARSAACWTPGASQDREGIAHVTLGYKGMIYLALRSSGALWGRGPRGGPIHGMAKSVVDSPVWRLIQGLATLTCADENGIAIDGFGARDWVPSPGETMEMEAIRTRFHGEPWQRVLAGVQGAMIPATDGLDDSEIYRRYFFGPSVNISGLRSGYTGPGTPTFTLPHLAEAFLDIRIPRTWRTGEVLRALRSRLDACGFSAIETEVFGAFDGSRVAPDAHIVRAAKDMFESAGLDILWWPATGGGGPWSIFATELGLPVLRDIGLGHGRASLTDEYLVIDGAEKVGGIVEMALSHAELMLRMGET